MSRFKKYFILLALIFPVLAKAQELSNFRLQKLKAVTGDSIQLDTLSIIPGSFKLIDQRGDAIDTASYKVDYAKGVLILDKRKINNDSLIVVYRTFPFNLAKPLKNKELSSILPGQAGATNPFRITYDNKSEDIFKSEGLNKNGSISRGISFGNNQDLVVNSNLNLQLSGKLSKNIDILAAITDENIPIQPDGNTQQLQDFDKVFIQLSDDRSKLIAGDFQLERPDSYFMNYFKKAQGASFSTGFYTKKHVKVNDSIVDPKAFHVSFNTSGAISKGKFARNVFQGIEGNQGPYRLTGAENELFIIVLAGTEKVYLDGELVKRGLENDYVIDYNTGEVIFTPKRLITKDVRIVAEFQYSDKNYSRTLLHFGSQVKNEKLEIDFNFYNEQDNKNKPLQQDLTEENALLLQNIGDSLSEAVVPNVDSVAYEAGSVLYKKVDTLVNAIIYPGVYIYSNNPDSAFYRVGFSFVGEGRGNYVQTNNIVNGKVFSWIAPIGGIPQGSYEPVVLLITPKKKQMYALGTKYRFNKNTSIRAEAAVSNNDVNTFSSFNSKDDIGQALRIGFENTTPFGTSEKDPWKLRSVLNYELVTENFEVIERYRPTEFDRDWNFSATKGAQQHLTELALNLSKSDFLSIAYGLNSFVEEGTYTGFQNVFGSSFKKKGFNVFFDGSYMTSEAVFVNSEFLKQKATISQDIGKITIGLKERQEKNLVRNAITDSLLLTSMELLEWEAFVQNADTMKNRFTLFYKNTSGSLPKNNSLKKESTSDNVGLITSILKNENSSLKTNTTYRRLKILDTTLSQQKDDQTFLNRIEYDLQILKGFIRSGTFYEVSSGLEVKKEYSFVKVIEGQGAYVWIDYDSSGTQELNEFELANPELNQPGDYIKVYTPTNEYVKVFTQGFTQTFNIKPASLWRNRKGIKQFLSSFSNLTALQINKKTNNDNLNYILNPFINNSNDSSLVSLANSLRNILSFNQKLNIFSIDYIWEDHLNKTLLVNGYETRNNLSQEVRTRWNINKYFTFNTGYLWATKYSSAELLINKNYRVVADVSDSKISYQPNASFRIALLFKYTYKKNVGAVAEMEKATIQKAGTEIKYNVVSKGSFNLKVNYYLNTYNAVMNTPLAYEMLEGLQKGANINWGISYQRNISANMQLSFNYDGLKSEGIRTTHRGGVQLRAVF